MRVRLRRRMTAPWGIPKRELRKDPDSVELDDDLLLDAAAIGVGESSLAPRFLRPLVRPVDFDLLEALLTDAVSAAAKSLAYWA